MPRARRRRRGRRPRRRSAGAIITISIVVVLAGVLVIGSIVEINAQSGPYRRMTDQGYAQLASRVVDASNQSGARLAAVISAAPTIPNQPLPDTARGEVQQGLDAALASTADEAHQARQLTPPTPSDDVASQFTAIIEGVGGGGGQRGVHHRPAAGDGSAADCRGPEPDHHHVGPPGGAHLRDPGFPTTGGGGHPDPAGRPRLRRLGGHHFDRRSPRRRFDPGAGLDLGPGRWRAHFHPTRQRRRATHHRGALFPFHQMVITAVGLAPPAVPSPAPNNPAGSGTIATSCNPPNPTSTIAGPTPTSCPPPGSVTPLVTVTNCGTVSETNVTVTEKLALADGPGASAPPAGAAGSSAQTTVSALSGQSRALSFPGLQVASGHTYTLTISLAPPAGQQNLAGTSQQFLLQIVG